MKWQMMILYKSFSGEEGFIIAFRKTLKEKIMSRISNLGKPYGLTAIGPETRETLRLLIERYTDDLELVSVELCGQLCF